MSSTRGRTPNWGDEGGDEAPHPTPPAVAWWKRALVGVPAVIGVGVMLLGLFQLVPLLPRLAARDETTDGALGAGPAMFLILFGAAVLGIAILIRWALGSARRQ
jgi:hypothetical protein